MKAFASFLGTMLLICLVALPPCAARASIFGEAPGTDAPAATLGPYTMTSFPDDTRDLGVYFQFVESPLGGTVDFSPDVMHLTISPSQGWLSWSHGYSGDVYWTSTNVSSVELTLPAETGAFYFYAQPRTNSGTVNITASSNGTTFNQDVESDGGASYFGFYADGTDTISSITITADTDFAVGEFGIAGAQVIPDEIQAVIDIDPDTLNLNSKSKWITCYIELPGDYDVEEIEVSTIKLNDQVPVESRPTGVGDCDDDGIAELMVKFDRSAVQEILEAGDEVEITVTGELNDDTKFEGSDTIRVINKGGKK
jgi:hypothetical protein